MTSQRVLPELVRDTRLRTTIQENLTIHTRPRARWGASRYETWLRQRVLNSGGFGVVFLEHKVNDGEQQADQKECRAVKSIRISGPKPVSNESDISEYVRELEALAKFSQTKYAEFFVKFFGWYENSSYLYIAMEYCEYGDLHEHLMQVKTLPEDQVKEVASQLLEGLQLMHDGGFAHRDLKPRNVLIKSKPPDHWWVKLGDLGLSKRIEDVAGNSTIRGTPGFMPPEAYGFYGDPRMADPFMADMWCFGETVFQALTGQPTFKTIADLTRYQGGVEGFPEQPLLRENASKESKDFISLLMAADPRSRLTAAKALDHPWIEQEVEKSVCIPGLSHRSNSLETDMSNWHPNLAISDSEQAGRPSGVWTVTEPYQKPVNGHPRDDSGGRVGALEVVQVSRVLSKGEIKSEKLDDDGKGYKKASENEGHPIPGISVSSTYDEYKEASDFDRLFDASADYADQGRRLAPEVSDTSVNYQYYSEFRDSQDTDALGLRYEVQPIAMFEPGEILKVVWSGPVSQTSSAHRLVDSETPPSQDDLPKHFHVEVRTFIIVATDESNFTCVAISTHGNRGCLKKGTIPAKHGIVVERGQKPMILNGEPKLGFRPVRVIVTKQGQKLRRSSRVNYSMLFTVEHTTRVCFIGYVMPEDWDLVRAAVAKCWEEKIHHRQEKNW